MCGKRLNRTLLALALLLLPLSGLYSDAIWPAEEPAYTITESELTELETILTRQKATIESLQQWLTISRSTIDELQTRLNRQHETLTALSVSFSEYERAVRLATIRNVTISVTVGAAVGLITGILLF